MLNNASISNRSLGCDFQLQIILNKQSNKLTRLCQILFANSLAKEDLPEPGLPIILILLYLLNFKIIKMASRHQKYFRNNNYFH